jgi:glycosyltransferase involved in cell wall biosynthesis
LEKVKGVDMLLKSWASLERKFPSAMLLIVGTGGDKATLENLSHDLGITVTCKFTGFRSDIPELLGSSDVFVLPSYAEGMSNSLLEAMSAGLSVVSTRTGRAPDFVMDGVTGLLVPPGDEEAITSAISKLLKDDDYKQSLGSEARKYVCSNFDFQIVTDTYCKFYEGLVENGREM